MHRILATASALALLAAAPALAANPAAAPNGSAAYQPTNQAANANGNQAATTTANTGGAQTANTNAAPATAAPRANATAPTTNGEQAANTNGATTTATPAPNNTSEQGANNAAAPNMNGEQAATTNGAPASNNANEAAGATAPNNASEQSANNATATNQSISKMDRKFVNEAASASMAEIAEGKLAMQRASDLAVRQFGRWMVTDHTQMVTMLGAPAKAAGIEVSSKLLPQDQKQFDQLQSQNGVEFEKQYVSGQVAAHQKALQLFQEEAQSGQDAGLRALAKMGEPMLKQHLAAAQELQSAMPEIVAATQNATKK